MRTLKEEMLHWKGVARKGDPDACRDSTRWAALAKAELTKK